MADRQSLIGKNSATGAAPSAPPQAAPPPYAPPSSGYGAGGGGYQSGPSGYAAHPGYQQQQQHTTVIVTRQQPVHVPVEVKPPNYIAMSVLTMLFCCFLFGLIALIMSFQSDSAWARGDRDEAHRLSMAARKWNVISIVGGVFFTAGWVITVIAVSVSVNSYSY